MSRANEIIREARKKKRQKTIFTIVSLILLVVAIAASYYYRLSVEKSIELEKRVEETQAQVYEKERTIEENAKRRYEERMITLYSTYFPLTVHVRKTSGTLIISGNIKNMGRFEANDIELLVALLNGADRIIHEETIVASSTDSKPLTRGQRRYFQHTITNPPAEAVDVVVIINSVDFVGGKPWKDSSLL